MGAEGRVGIGRFSQGNLEGSYLLHHLPQLPAPAIAGAGALRGDHGRADAFSIGSLGRGVQLPAFLWALEEGLRGSRSQRVGTQWGNHPITPGREKGPRRDDRRLLLDPWNVPDHVLRARRV